MPYPACMWRAALPDDLLHLIHRLYQATVLQRVWRRHMWRHAARAAWSRLRAHSFGTWRGDDYHVLERYATVRAEWRTEPESWLRVGAPEATVLRAECELGFWGQRTRFL